jgi:hypothetical protein
MDYISSVTYLNEFRVLATGAETFFDGTDEPLRGPDNVLRALDNNTVTCKDGSENR